jgi:hypothetical protein
MLQLEHDTITYILMAVLYCIGSGICAILLGRLLGGGEDDGDDQ